MAVTKVIVPIFVFCSLIQAHTYNAMFNKEALSSMAITKVVIPAAGLGTRFLPYTKIIPKEMIALGDKPAIQYIIQEGVDSGIHDFYIIANDDKPEIFRYFEPFPELEKKLAAKGKLHLLDGIKKIQESAAIHAIEQPEPLGLGHAVLQAKRAIGDSYFGVILPDDIMVCSTPALVQLISIAQHYHASVLAVQEVPREKISSYGIIKVKKQLTSDVFELSDVTEKPSLEEAPSNLGIIGRYVLSPRIFDSLEQTKPGSGGEIQLTDGIKHMMHTYGEKVLAVKVSGTRYDVGNPKGWLEAINALVK
jgi:UTP--glucose-1-phosphate uridylyltransferase